MLAFALLSIATTVFTTIALTTLASRRMNSALRDKSTQYARQLQRELETVVAFDDHVTARELMDSLIGDRDVDGIAVFTEAGELFEGRGIYPRQFKSLTVESRGDGDHAITVAKISSREGPSARLYMSLSTRSIDDLQRRDAWIACGIAGTIVLLALVLAIAASRGIVRRLELIASAANLVALGERSHPPLDDRARDEIGGLAHAFNVMVFELNRLSTEHARLVSTERERLESQVAERTQDLEQSREMFRLIAESTQAVPFSLDLVSGCFPYVGSLDVVRSGVPQRLWKERGSVDLIFPREHNRDLRVRFDQCMTGAFEFESTVLRGDGARSELRWTGTCSMSTDTKVLRGLMQDVTELRRLERELTAAQKLESVGRLAAGVAHEINTPVQFVSDNVQFLREAMSDIATMVAACRATQDAALTGGDVLGAARHAAKIDAGVDWDFLMKDIPRALEGTAEGLRRIATIVRSMKEFAHPDQADKMPVDLNQAIQSTLVIALNEYKYIAEIDTQFGELPLVVCYLGEINQVILNLVINAAHAIADVVKGTSDKGKLTIRTRLEGETVEIAVSDTGTGIPVAARDKIFDPFFTTKEVGRGTGQGLAIARSVIVNKHGGTLRFETECGGGTTFFIRLPINPSDSAESREAA
jgi:signal transduction histidine kinase/HAMP domain-containing protein